MLSAIRLLGAGWPPEAELAHGDEEDAPPELLHGREVGATEDEEQDAKLRKLVLELETLKQRKREREKQQGLASSEEDESDDESEDGDGLSTTTVVIIVVLVILLAGGGAAAAVVLTMQSSDPSPPSVASPPPTPVASPLPIPPPPSPGPNPPPPSVVLFSPSPHPPPRPPFEPLPKPPPPPLNPCLSSGDAVRLALDGSELVISNVQNKGPDVGQREEIRYANGGQVFSTTLGMFVYFDVVIRFVTPWEVDDPAGNGKLFGTGNSITHWKLRRGTEVLVEAELMPTCCQNLPTCLYCDIKDPDRATCYANGCCCKGTIITTLDGCTDEFRAQRNYSCVNMEQRQQGGSVLPDYINIVFTFFNMAIGEYAEIYNVSYTRTPLRADSGADIESRLSRSGNRFTGTVGIPYGNAVTDPDVLTDQQAANSVTTFKPPSKFCYSNHTPRYRPHTAEPFKLFWVGIAAGITRFVIGSDSQGPPGDYCAPCVNQTTLYVHGI